MCSLYRAGQVAGAKLLLLLVQVFEAIIIFVLCAAQSILENVDSGFQWSDLVINLIVLSIVSVFIFCHNSFCDKQKLWKFLIRKRVEHSYVNQSSVRLGASWRQILRKKLSVNVFCLIYFVAGLR